MLKLGQQLFKNILSSWAGFFIRIVITFIFVPIITSTYGDARYGVWVILFQTINYFSLLDLGLGTALTRYVSKYLSQKNVLKINKVLNSANVIYFILGTLVLAGVYLFVVFFFNYFKIGSSELISEGKTALLILGFSLAINFYLFSFGNSLAAFQRHDINRLLTIVEEIVRVVIWIWLIKNGYGLVSLALVILIMNLLRHLAAIIILKKLYPEIKFSFSLPDQKMTKKLLGYSKISFGITIGWLIIFNTDTFLLGLFSSSAAAGIYNPGTQLMLYLRNFVNAIGVPLTPAISHLDTNNDRERIKRIYHKGIKYVSYFSFVALVGVIFYAHPFVKLWLPPEFYQSADVMIILSIGTAFFLPQIIGNSILFGSENHKHILQVLILESLSKIILAVILIPRYNIIGMAFANTIPQIIFYTTLYPYYMSRLLRISYRHIITTILSMGLLGTLVSLPTALWLKKIIPVNSWSMLVINVFIILIIALLPAYFIIDREDKRKIVNFFKK